MSEARFRRLCNKYGYNVSKRRGYDEWTIYTGEKEEVKKPDFVGTFREAVAWLSKPSGAGA